MHLQVWNTLSLRLWSEKCRVWAPVPFVSVPGWPYQSILLSFWLDIFITSNIFYFLLKSIFGCQGSSDSFKTKPGVDKRDSRTVLTFFRWHFCIFLFVERCFWLSAPALYHSAHHASVTTLCKVRIYLLKDVYDLSWFMMHQQSYCVSTVILWCDGRFAFINYLGLSIIYDRLMMKNVIWLKYCYFNHTMTSTSILLT